MTYKDPQGKSKYDKEYRQENKERIDTRVKKWRKENPDKVKATHNKYITKRRATPKGRLEHSMGTAIYLVLKKNKASKKWESLVGYTIEDLMSHIEILFDSQMSWDNYGSYWDIDHVKPKSLFQYNTIEDPEFKKCWALDNLQPLEHIANIKKHNHYEVDNTQ